MSEDLKARLKAVQQLQRWALKSESAPRLHAMVDLARSEPTLAIAHDQLDRDPMLLNVENGTIDLRTGRLREHRREDLLTKLSPTEYDPGAPCPTWEHFLDAVFAGRRGVVTFMQRLCGYSLTADISEQILVILWGCGSNGKSTFVNAILETLGEDYAIRISSDLLLASAFEQHPTGLADLFGRRLAVTSETGRGRALNESLVKDLTGGEPIRARRMRQDYWQFAPSHKLWMVTNHKPMIRDTDRGIWRRLRLIPFETTFWKPGEVAQEGEERDEQLRADPGLPEKLRAERRGILAWMVRGCLDWQRDGLTEPEEVLAATQEYRTSQDELQPFLEERCHVGSDTFRVRASRLYDAYAAWCKQAGEDTLSLRRFGEALAERGFKKKSSNGIWIIGLTLAEEAKQ